MNTVLKVYVYTFSNKIYLLDLCSPESLRKIEFVKVKLGIELKETCQIILEILKNIIRLIISYLHFY